MYSFKITVAATTTIIAADAVTITSAVLVTDNNDSNENIKKLNFWVHLVIQNFFKVNS